MKTYTFEVRKGGAGTPFELTLQAGNKKKAEKAVEELYPAKDNAVSFVDSHKGTIEDFLGQDTVERIEKKKGVLRFQENEKKLARERSRARGGLNKHV